MAVLTIEEEMQRAHLEPAFVDDEAFEAWMRIWCDECSRTGCPLITVAAMNRTPEPWELVDVGAVNKFSCAGFERSNADDPTVVIEGGQAPQM
jgi:hypothetical protein